jgi:sugar phosphate isomerase/epimerase
MRPYSITRREFITTTTLAAAAAALPRSTLAQSPAPVAKSPAAAPLIGVYGPRVWVKFNLGTDALLDAAKAAGFRSVEMLGGGSGAARIKGTPPAPESIREKLEARGLVSTVGSLVVPERTPHAEAVASTRAQLKRMQVIGQKYALCGGLNDESQWIPFCKVLNDAAAFGQDLGIQITTKHHHGLNNTAVELLGWMHQVNHPNFKLFFDPGNTIYYTGKDPVKQLDILGPHVTGWVAKDCSEAIYLERKSGDPAFGTRTPDPSGNEVMIQFGTGKVDFAGVYRKLKSYGFNGVIYVEGTTAGDTVEATIANARANLEFVKKAIA